MTVIDDRGRVLGRVNVIDAAAAVLLFVLIPVAYGAYLLFRTPAPRLTSVSPTKLYAGPNQRVRIEGANMRPYMRIAFGSTQGVTFAILSTTSAEVEVPNLQPGTYDVTLFDYRQEVAQLPRALTILNQAPVPTLEMEVSGSFKGMNAATAAQFKAGQTLSDGSQRAEVLRVGPPVPAVFRINAGTSLLSMQVPGELEVPATLRVQCYTEAAGDGSVRCMVPGPVHASPAAPNSIINLPGVNGWTTFQIATVALPAPPSMLTVHAVFSVHPDVAAMVKGGDTDAKAVAYANPASVAAVNARRTISPTQAVLDLTLRLPATLGSAGWTYNTQTIKAGLPIQFETADYSIAGQVLGVAPVAGVRP